MSLLKAVCVQSIFLQILTRVHVDIALDRVSKDVKSSVGIGLYKSKFPLRTCIRYCHLPTLHMFVRCSRLCIASHLLCLFDACRVLVTPGGSLSLQFALGLIQKPSVAIEQLYSWKPTNQPTNRHSTEISAPQQQLLRSSDRLSPQISRPKKPPKNV